MVTEKFPMTIGDEEVLNEHLLLAYNEDGKMMDSPQSVRFLVIHCSATKCNRNYTEKQLLRDHKARGFRTVGYHFYYRKDENRRNTVHKRTTQRLLPGFYPDL